MQDYIRYERKGSSELIKAKRIESEVLQFKLKRKKTWVYLGVHPQVIERKSFLGLRKSARLYFVREGEPFARDAYTGEYADDEKMFQAMLSKGAIDEWGLLLHDEKGLPYYGRGEEQEVITLEEYDGICDKLEQKEKLPEVTDKLATLKSFLDEHEKRLFIFEDVSKMEYLLEEALLLTEGKVAQGLADAARKEFMGAKDWVMLTIIIASTIWNMFALYFLMKGMGYSV